MAEDKPATLLPTSEEISEAIEVYMRQAYGENRPASALNRIPDKGFDVASYLAGDSVERSPCGDDGCNCGGSYLIRLGNAMYPHMKLKLAYVPGQVAWVFSVDSHDAMLQAPEGSPDASGLQELKDFNAQLAEKIEAQWEQAGLMTLKGLLRRRIQQQKQENT